jgi:hypothetical protein
MGRGEYLRKSGCTKLKLAILSFILSTKCQVKILMDLIKQLVKEQR